jgi:hypothetical protein
MARIIVGQKYRLLVRLGLEFIRLALDHDHDHVGVQFIKPGKAIQKTLSNAWFAAMRQNARSGGRA